MRRSVISRRLTLTRTDVYHPFASLTRDTKLRSSSYDPASAGHRVRWLFFHLSLPFDRLRTSGQLVSTGFQAQS